MEKYIIFWILRFTIQFVILWILADTMYHYCIAEKVNQSINSFKPKNRLFYNIFVLTPKRLSEYLLYINSREFHESGMILYCGAQGEGKSYAMCHEVTKLFTRYPDMKIFSNIWFEISDGYMIDSKTLLEEENGENGICFMLDEISMWWNSRFRNLDPAILSELVTNRKNHRVLFGTCQNISMCDKQVRLQASEFRNCHCFFGFLVICTCWKPVFEMSTGDLKDKHFLGFKVYFQDDVIRASYDTYEMINLLKDHGSQYEKPIEIVTKGNENEKRTLLQRIKGVANN